MKTWVLGVKIQYLVAQCSSLAKNQCWNSNQLLLLGLEIRTSWVYKTLEPSALSLKDEMHLNHAVGDKGIVDQ